MNLDKSFGETIKSLREAKRLPLREVANALEIDISMIGKIEKNNRRPTNKLIEKFASYFNVSNKDLTITYLSDAVVYQVLEESECAIEVLMVAKKKISFLQNNK